jgi:glycosyltransferase involved in cell wall biosynthesis
MAAVRFLGKRKDVEAIVATLDIGVLCTFVEGLSNSVMEYMAAGKPVVATGGGGTCELVVDGETGCLVPARNAALLAATIEALVDDPERCSRMGLAGQAKLRREFSLERMVECTTALYETAAAASKRGDARPRLRPC